MYWTVHDVRRCSVTLLRYVAADRPDAVSVYMYTTDGQSSTAQVLQGKVWVFGEGGPHAFIDSAAVKPALLPELEDSWPPRCPPCASMYLLLLQIVL